MGFFDDEDELAETTETPPSSLEEADPVQSHLQAQDEIADTDIEMNNAETVPREPIGVPAQPAAPVHPYQQMYEEYKQLQKDRDRQQGLINMAHGSAMIGAGAAGTVSGKTDVDAAPYESMLKQAGQRVAEFDKGISIKDADQLRNPGSPISQFYRQMAMKRGFAPEEVEGKSAWDLQQMAKVLGTNRAPKTAPTKNFRDNKSGKDMIGTPQYDGEGHFLGMRVPGVAELYTDIAPFQPKFFTNNPDTGGIVGLDKTDNSMTPVTGPAPLPKDPKELEKLDADTIFQKHLHPIDVKTVKEAKEKYNKEVMPTLNAYKKIDSVFALIDDAVNNPQSKNKVGSITAEIFEPGSKKTDQDVVRYVESAGYGPKLQSWYDRNWEGEFNEKDAADLKQSLLVYKKGLAESIRKNHMDRGKNLLLKTPGLTDRQKADLIYRDSGVVRVRPVGTTKVMEVTEEQAKKLLSDPKLFEKVP